MTKIEICPNCDTPMEELPIIMGDIEIGHGVVCPKCKFEYDGEQYERECEQDE